MSDVPMRGVPEEVQVAIDARASSLGVPGVDYLRRRIVQDARAVSLAVSVHDLGVFADRHADSTDPDLMRRAWN
jgi:hypothetical protein